MPAALQTVDVHASAVPSTWIEKYSKIWPNIIAQLKVRHSISEILHHEFMEVYLFIILFSNYTSSCVCHQKKLLVRRKLTSITTTTSKQASVHIPCKHPRHRSTSRQLHCWIFCNKGAYLAVAGLCSNGLTN